MLAFDEVSWFGLLFVFYSSACKNCAWVDCGLHAESVQAEGLTSLASSTIPGSRISSAKDERLVWELIDEPNLAQPNGGCSEENRTLMLA